MTTKIINGDMLDVLPTLGSFDCVFADPPDNIGLKYDKHKDDMPTWRYLGLLEAWLFNATRKAPIVWVSFNAKWTIEFGHIARNYLEAFKAWECRPCVQTFTFGQNQKNDFTNGHRPLWRFNVVGTPFYPDAILVESWRQQHGDKRANPKGRVPDDVFDFPRVTGNSKQRRSWHKTQLHEGLVERCIRFSTPEGGSVLDPFGGTGTTARVCERIGRQSTLVELSLNYCRKMAAELKTKVQR